MEETRVKQRFDPFIPIGDAASSALLTLLVHEVCSGLAITLFFWVYEACQIEQLYAVYPLEDP